MLKFIALLSIFSVIIPIHCSQQPWYGSFINEWSIYKKTTIAIDIVMTIKAMALRPIMAINPDKFIAIEENRLKQIEKNIRTAEANAIYAIIKENGLGSEYAIGLQNRRKELHKSRKEYLSKSQPNIIHDEGLSPELVKIIEKQLTREQIDINSIHLIKSAIPSEYGHDASTVSPSPFYFSIDGDTVSVFNQNTDPGNITFFPKFDSYTQEEQLAFGIHEAGHMIEGHDTTTGDIFHYINFYTHKDPDEICKSKKFKKLLQIHERQAEVLPSLKNKKSAALIRKMRSVIHYPNMLYGKHYLQISNIDEKHKMIAYLKHIKKNNQQNIQ